MDKYFIKVREFFRHNPKVVVSIRVFLYLCLVITIGFVCTYAWVYSTIPSRETFKSIKNNTSTEIYSSDGKLIGKYFLQDRTNVSLEEISPHVINALIATEDVRFYEHNGIDNRGLLRVIFKTLLLGDESSGGGSTITQQLAKNLFPRRNFPILSLPINKIREAITAEKLEDVFNKNEILVFYLNTVPFGENAFGIEVASRRFFNKTADSLNLQEAATLVGMLKATTSFNPKRNPENSKTRRNVVLNQMSKYGFISSDIEDSVQALPIKLDYRFINHNQGIATYFREHLRQELLNWCSENKKPDGSNYNLYTDGLKIYTTLDATLQKYAEEAVGTHMQKLQSQFLQHWGKQSPWGRNKSVVEDAVRRSPRYKRLKESGASDKEILKAFNTPVNTKVFTYKGEEVREMTPLDSIKHYLKFLHSGFLVVDPQSHEVKAWVGGINHKYFQYDHIHKKAKRQVGSTFKPIVYAAALEEGVSPCDYFENEKQVYEEYDNWSPGNADDKYGGKYSMEGALTNSVNTVSAQLIMKAGIDNVVTLAKRMGIRSNLKPVPSLALGTADVSLYEMVGAYSVFPAKGYYEEPSYIVRIENSSGEVLADFTKDSKRSMALSSYNSAMMVEMMQSVVNQGTAARLRTQYNLNVPMAGKTGTTQSQADGWFIGYTPDLVGGVWVGAEDRRVHFRSLRLGQGANMALPIWGEFMKRVLNDPKYSYMKKSKFPELSQTAQLQLDCEPYIGPEPEDTLNFWDKLFGVQNDSVREAQREQKRKEREERRRERGNENKDRFIDNLFNIFRKKPK